jgi:uncharacterized protein (DUF488 family)
VKGLFTIGYEGTSLDDFLAALENSAIDVLLDIREIPISRRQGFSKNALNEALAEIDINYRHERSLGSPKAIRHKYREDGNHQAFFRAFERYLLKQNSLLLELADELRGNVALMCYEKDHTQCHRSSVVNALAEISGLEPTHLEVNPNEQGKTRHTSHKDHRQGIPAT